MKWFGKKANKILHPLPPAAALSVSGYLAPRQICFFPQGTSKKDILEELVKRLPYPNPKTALAAVWEREKLGSTVLENGIAFPHARLLDLPDIQAAIGVCPAGVPESVGAPVRLFVLFIGPANHMKRNLDFMASVAALFQTEGFPDSLLSAPDPESVLARIREAEKR